MKASVLTYWLGKKTEMMKVCLQMRLLHRDQLYNAEIVCFVYTRVALLQDFLDMSGILVL